jgi:hypothetical protein
MPVIQSQFKPLNIDSFGYSQPPFIESLAGVARMHRTGNDSDRIDLTARSTSPKGSALGPMAEWLRRGLQILARRFDSGSGLHFFSFKIHAFQ